MNVSTSLPIHSSFKHSALRNDTVYHSSLDLLASGFGNDMVTHGVGSRHIGHQVGPVASFNTLQFEVDGVTGLGQWAGTLLFVGES